MSGRATFDLFVLSFLKTVLHCFLFFFFCFEFCYSMDSDCFLFFFLSFFQITNSFILSFIERLVIHSFTHSLGPFVSFILMEFAAKRSLLSTPRMPTRCRIPRENDRFGSLYRHSSLSPSIPPKGGNRETQSGAGGCETGVGESRDVDERDARSDGFGRLQQRAANQSAE